MRRILTGILFIICFIPVELCAQAINQESAQSAQDYYYRGKVLDSQGKYNEAKLEIEKALALAPDFGKAHLMLGVCYSRKNMNRDAILEYKKAIALNMDNKNLAVAHHNLGVEYLHFGMSEEAGAEFKQALKFDPYFKEPKKALQQMSFSGFLDSNLAIVIPIAVFFIIIFAIVFAAVFLINSKKRRILKELAANLSAYIPKISWYASLKGNYLGLNYSIALIPASRNSPAYLVIRLFKNSFFKLRIYKESFLSNLGKKIGLVREAKIRDEIFDSEFLIFSNKPEIAASYLNNANKKNAIRELFNAGFNALLIDGRKVSISKPNYILEQDLAAQNIRELLQKLNLLAQGL